MDIHARFAPTDNGSCVIANMNREETHRLICAQVPFETKIQLASADHHPSNGPASSRAAQAKSTHCFPLAAYETVLRPSLTGPGRRIVELLLRFDPIRLRTEPLGGAWLGDLSGRRRDFHVTSSIRSLLVVRPGAPSSVLVTRSHIWMI